MDFYQNFWDTIGQDFYEVLLDCIRSKILPTSCRRAVLSLLPKKGDLGFRKNWRPVSLLCSNYKIISKCLANIMKHCLDLLVHNDQTYCIPERSMMDNLFLLRDVGVGSGHLGYKPYRDSFIIKMWHGPKLQVFF